MRYKRYMEKLSLPWISERIIGVTIPHDGEFFVCDHDEVFCIRLADPPIISQTSHNPHKFIEGCNDFIGLVLAGIEANQALHKVGGSKIDHDFKVGDEDVLVRYDIAGQQGEIRFKTFSGDWFVASLSTDAKHLILADPYDLAVYKV